MVPWTVYLSFAGAAALMVLPRGNPRLVRWSALALALAGALCGATGAALLAPGQPALTLTRVPWVSSLGIEYHLGLDGINVTLVWLTGIAAVAGVLFSWNVTDRPREFFALYFVLIGGVYGVFLSQDLFLLFFFYEVAIIPKYFLIAIWGSTRREYGAMKLALYTFIGSALVFIGLVAVHTVAAKLHGSPTLDLATLARLDYAPDFQRWAFPLLFVGFGVLAGLWPLHTWAPTGHVAAPTAASMLLAGVVMKLGAYGALRAGVALFPAGLEAWRDVLAALGTAGIVYGALVAMVQKDFKFVVGYSSVSHMGFVMLGLVTGTALGVSGAVLQMFSHGIIAGLLFAVVGRMIYDRAHTRQLDELAALGLARRLPFAAGVFVLAAMASMGLPGFSGFIAEISVLLGAWRDFPVLTVLAGVGVVLGVVYTLRAVQTAFFPDGGAAAGAGSGAESLEPITPAERCGAVLLLLATVGVGLFPRLLLDYIQPAVQALLPGLTRGGAS